MDSLFFLSFFKYVDGIVVIFFEAERIKFLDFQKTDHLPIRMEENSNDGVHQPILRPLNFLELKLNLEKQDFKCNSNELELMLISSVD